MPTNGFSIKTLKVKLLAGEQKATELLWVDEILHHFETIANHCLLVFTLGKHRPAGFFRWCEMDFAIIHTVDGQNPAPPKKPWQDDFSKNNSNKLMVSHSFKVVRN